MPLIKSAKKRVKVNNKAAVRNSKTKRSLKTAIKSFGKALTAVRDAESRMRFLGYRADPCRQDIRGDS